MFPVNYNLAENIWGEAKIESKNDKILLWLGASVMLEYSYTEAEELLTNNLKNAI